MKTSQGGANSLEVRLAKQISVLEAHGYVLTRSEQGGMSYFLRLYRGSVIDVAIWGERGDEFVDVWARPDDAQVEDVDVRTLCELITAKVEDRRWSLEHQANWLCTNIEAVESLFQEPSLKETLRRVRMSENARFKRRFGPITRQPCLVSAVRDVRLGGDRG